MSKARLSPLEECRHYLGELGAFLFFFRVALDPNVTGVKLLSWTLRLQTALLTRKKENALNQGAQASGVPLKALKIGAPQISTWRHANPISWTAPPPEQELSLRILAIDVVLAPKPEAHAPWRGHLLIVYHPRSDTLVHHLLKIDSPTRVTSDWILYVLGEAQHAIRSRIPVETQTQDLTSIAMPDVSRTTPQLADAYTEAADRLMTATSAETLTATWLNTHHTTIELKNVHIDRHSDRSAHIDVTFESARSFSNTLIRVANAFNRIAPKDSAHWVALNPPKGKIDRKPGWADMKSQTR